MTNKKKKSCQKRHWLIKFAPFRTEWSEIVRRGTFTMRGVRSAEARNNLKMMRKGDLVLFYQSQRDQAVVGLMKVSKTAYPDPTSNDPQWLTCDLIPIKTLEKSVSLAAIKADSHLVEIPLVRKPRLAVMPLTTDGYDRILHLSEIHGD